MPKKDDKQNKKGTNGASLDTAAKAKSDLPHGLVRLPSGMIAVTHLYCPNGHNLVEEGSAALFSGQSGISLDVKGAKLNGKVILSPIHGDDAKFGESGFEPGEVLRIACPVCGVEFPKIQACGCTEGAELIGLYLDENLKAGDQVVLCNAWGCMRSRIIDRFQVISQCG